MRVADVSAFYAPRGGGVRTYVERKLAYAEANGIELAVIVPGGDDRIEQRGPRTRLIQVASPFMPFDKRYRYFAEAAPVHALLDEIAPDFVEASSPWRTASIVADWRGPAPRALVMHADPLAAYAYRWLGSVMRRDAIDRGFDWFWAHLRRVGRSFSLVVSASAQLSRRLSEGGVPRTATIPLGVEAGIFSPAHRNEALRRALLARCDLGGAAMLLIGAGRHAPEKRWTTMIDAAAIAGVRRSVGLVLVGEGRERARLERRIGGNPHIRLMPPVADRAEMARLLASADALLHGCEAETFGLVAAEARASGLPLIVPQGGAAADLAAPGCAESYRAADAADAAAAILRMAARDRAALRDAAVRAAAGSRTIDAHFDDLFGRYAILAARRAAA